MAFAVPVFHLAVVLEKSDIVGCGFDPQDAAELVVHLDGCGPHVVTNSRAQDACIEVVAGLDAYACRKTSSTRPSRHYAQSRAMCRRMLFRFLQSLEADTRYLISDSQVSCLVPATPA